MRCEWPYEVSKTTWKELSEHCCSHRKDEKVVSARDLMPR